MSGSSHERRAHFRGKSRAGRTLAVRVAANPTGLPVSAATHANWRGAETRDIGVGGAFIVDPALTVGMQIWVELQLPTTAQRFVLPAIVRWVGDGRGAGVQFVDVDVDVLLELNDYFEAL